MNRPLLYIGRCRYALILVLVFLLAGCKQEALLHKLEEGQANEVVDALLRNRIDASKTEEGKGLYQVNVSRSDFPQAVETITQYGLPSGQRTQISSAFPTDALVSTPLGERARLYSAIEQRLEDSLGAFHGVRQARVNVSYMPLQSSGESALATAPPGMRLSALLTIEPGADEVGLVQSAKRYLRNTFPDVDYEDISIITTPMANQRYLAGPPVQTFWSDWWIWVFVGGMVLFGAALAWRPAHKRWGSALSKRLRRDVARDGHV